LTEFVLVNIPPSICQQFYALGQLRPTDTPDVIQDFYSYIGIFSLSFDAVLQPGCNGVDADFPSRFLNNVRSLSGRALLDVAIVDRPTAAL
jgi:hypothetical protein